MRNLFRRSISNIFLTYLGRALQFAFYIVAARLKDDRFVGEYSILLTISSLLALLVGFGTERWIIKTTAESPVSIRQVLFVSIRLHAIITLITLILLALALSVLPAGFFGISTSVLVWSVVLGFATACMNSTISAQYGLGRVNIAGFIGFLSSLLSFVFSGAAILISGSISAIAVAILIERVFSIGFGYAYSNRSMTAQPQSPLKLPWKLIISIAAFNVMAYLYQRVDTLLLIPYVSVGTIGQYSIAYRVLEAFLLMPGLISLVAFSDSVTGNISPEEKQRMLISAIVLSVAICLAITIAVVLVSPYLLPALFGANYTLAASLLNIIIYGLLFQAFNPILNRWFSAYGRDQYLTLIGAIALLSNLALNWFLIPRFGAKGAAFATLGSYGLVTAAYIYLMIRLKLINMASVPHQVTSIITSPLRMRRTQQH